MYYTPNKEKSWDNNHNLHASRQAQDQNDHYGLPVMVWIHGGALVTGGGGGFFDPTRIIEQSGEIVVTINYRLGFRGFFAHPAIDAENHLKGNYGLMDQQQHLSGFGTTFQHLVAIPTE
jgi:carboxylesterase type B